MTREWSVIRSRQQGKSITTAVVNILSVVSKLENVYLSKINYYKNKRFIPEKVKKKILAFAKWQLHEIRLHINKLKGGFYG